jgi:hypothetical protein
VEEVRSDEHEDGGPAPAPRVLKAHRREAPLRPASTALLRLRWRACSGLAGERAGLGKERSSLDPEPAASTGTTDERGRRRWSRGVGEELRCPLAPCAKAGGLLGGGVLVADPHGGCKAATHGFKNWISNIELSPVPTLLNRTPTLLQCGRRRGPRQSANGKRSRAHVVLCALPRRRRDGRQQHREPPPCVSSSHLLSSLARIMTESSFTCSARV